MTLKEQLKMLLSKLKLSTWVDVVFLVVATIWFICSLMLGDILMILVSAGCCSWLAWDIEKSIREAINWEDFIDDEG